MKEASVKDRFVTRRKVGGKEQREEKIIHKKEFGFID